MFGKELFVRFTVLVFGEPFQGGTSVIVPQCYMLCLFVYGL